MTEATETERQDFINEHGWFDNALSTAEGWAVFHATYTDDAGDCRIERIDEDEKFDKDEDAWGHVIQKAVEGSAYHKAALRFVRQQNETEFERIATHSALMGYDLPSHIRD